MQEFRCNHCGFMSPDHHDECPDCGSIPSPEPLFYSRSADSAMPAAQPMKSREPRPGQLKAALQQLSDRHRGTLSAVPYDFLLSKYKRS